jgi:segregation and condensation protein A
MLDFKFESFEGPFELLLRLIEKNKIDIYKIPVAEITDQYIEYIENDKDMGELSQFIVMAGTLLELKSRALLPNLKIEKSEGVTPSEELTSKILEYKKFKDAAEIFKNSEIFANKTAFKAPETKLIEFVINDRLIKTEEILDGISMRYLYGVFTEAVKRKTRRLPVREPFGAVYKDAFTVEEKIDYLQETLDAKGAVLFSSIIEAARDKDEIVATFLALLEMIKLNLVKIIQNDVFGDIFIIYEFPAASKTSSVVAHR